MGKRQRVVAEGRRVLREEIKSFMQEWGIRWFSAEETKAKGLVFLRGGVVGFSEELESMLADPKRYDELQGYEHLYELRVRFFIEMVQIMERMKPSYVCDAGCAAGLDAIALARHFPEVQVRGYDNSGYLVEQAQIRAAYFGLDPRMFYPSDHLHKADDTGAFDIVYAKFSIAEGEDTLADSLPRIYGIARRLKPGGLLVVCDTEDLSMQRSWEGLTYVRRTDIMRVGDLETYLHHLRKT
ncbi:MAG: class I SAM-dependent methyltransferase [Candidatus Woesearchaeota archaeon]